MTQGDVTKEDIETLFAGLPVLIRKSVDYGVRSGVRYHERYKIQNGAWRIFYQRTEYLYWEQMTLRDGP